MRRGDHRGGAWWDEEEVGGGGHWRRGYLGPAEAATVTAAASFSANLTIISEGDGHLSAVLFYFHRPAVQVHAFSARAETMGHAGTLQL